MSTDASAEDEEVVEEEGAEAEGEASVQGDPSVRGEGEGEREGVVEDGNPSAQDDVVEEPPLPDLPSPWAKPEAAPAPAPEPPPKEKKAEGPPTLLGRLRGVVAIGQRMIAVGLLTVIGAAFVNGAVMLRFLLPYMAQSGYPFGPGIGGTLLRALVPQIGVILVLPILTWLVAWVLEDRPFRLAFGAAIFAESCFAAIALIGGGVEALVGDPLYLLGRLLFLALAAILAGLAYRHARSVADRKSAKT